jgi:AbrB family looped-hinge helix DNA binding protein
MVATRKRSRVNVKAKLTSKGQLTLPLAVRQHFGLQPGHEVHFEEDERGRIFIHRWLDPDRFEKVRGIAPSLAGRDPVEVIREMRGE